MRILDRYLIRSFLIPFVCCVFLFGCIFIIVDLFGHLDEILKYSIPPALLLKYYAAFYPITFVETSPMALLLAALYSLGILARHHEIRAMRSSGLSLFRIIAPYLFVGFLVAVVSFIVNETVVPQGSRLVALLEQSFGPPKEAKKGVVENISIYGKDRRLTYVESYDPRKKELKNLVILKDSPSFVPISKTWARRAFWANGHWILIEGFKTQLDPQGKLVGEPRYFKKERLDPGIVPGDLLQAKIQTGFMSYQQLKDHLQRLKRGKASLSVVRRFEVDLHRKIAFPFSNLVILWVGMPFVLKERRKAGALLGIAVSLALSFAFYTTFAITTALGKGGVLPAVASVWASNIAFGVVGFVLLRRAA